MRLLLDSLNSCEQLFGSLGPGRVFLDLETTGKNFRLHKIVSIALIVEDQYVSRAPCYIIDCRNLDLAELGKILESALCQSLIIGQNLKFDLNFLAYHCGIKPSDIMDFMLSEQVLHGRGFGSGVGFSLEDIAARRGVKVSKEERPWFIDLDQREEWSQPFPEDQLNYMEQDVRILERLYYYIVNDLEKSNLLDYAQFECAVTPCLVDIENNGIKVDKDQLREVIREEKEKYDRLEKECIEKFGPAILLSRVPEIEEYEKQMKKYVKEKEEYTCQLEKEFQRAGTNTKQLSLDLGV